RFTRVGAEKAEVVGNVMGSRSRIAIAFGVGIDSLLDEIRSRMKMAQALVEVATADAPVQEEVLSGEAADLTQLPVPFQHGGDGAPYLSSPIDVVVDPATGLYNVGCRRLMLRGRRSCGVDLNAPSDLKAIYEDAVEAGRPLPVSFVLGAHPIDHFTGAMRAPGDELELMAKLRGAPMPVVKCVTNDLLVPADAECVLEGYLSPEGHVEDEGPYGEFLGYYGGVKRNPVFHLTAITQRKDALFQTTSIAGRHMSCTDTAQLVALKAELGLWGALATAVRDPVAVYATTSSGGCFHARVALKQRSPGDARNAIAAVLGSFMNVKHVFVVDEDIDIFDDAQMDWAMASRFQADRDLVVLKGMRLPPVDPSMGSARVSAKAGFDLTIPFAERGNSEWAVPEPPDLTPSETRFESVEAALRDGPRQFEELMRCLGSADGREIVVELEALRESGQLARRRPGGRYSLK
ncbi:MAG: UbiD family decarboxylase, partial [Rhodospirillaceae bacterium]|nr:UbiD family decarboxylase [Rhodospirillaceae bacterium]